jgi:FkbM family methyltransferase
MTLSSLTLYLRIAAHFRNFPGVIGAVRKGAKCESVTLWNGLRFSHPAGQDGLASVLIETWLEKTYIGGGFYSPKAGDVVFDIGANIGVFAVHLAHKNPGCRIIAVEPYPENFEFLKYNIEKNRISNVETRLLALHADAVGAYMVKVGRRSLDHVLTCEPPDCPAFRVETCTLRDLLDRSGAGRVALLKVDIEGSEGAVFEQTDNETLRRFDRIALEYHDNLRPGTLSLLRRRLDATHHVEIRPSSVAGCGVIRAKLR